MQIIYFSQNVAPFPSACSIRSKYIIDELSKTKKVSKIIVYYSCDVKTPSETEKVVFKPLNVIIDSSNGIIIRFLLELFLSLKLVMRLIPHVFNKSNKFIISSPVYIPSLLSSIFLRFFRCDYCIDIRDAYPQVYENQGLIKKDSIIYRALSFLNKLAYEKSRYIFVVSEGLLEHTKSNYNLKNCQLAQNGFPERLLKIKTKKYNRFTISIHGNFGAFQDHKTLIAIINHKSMGGINFSITGFGSNFDKLYDLKSDRVKISKIKSFDEVIAETSKCHIGLSLRDNSFISTTSFPVKVWEYIGLGMPVILSPISDAGFFIQDNKLGQQFAYGSLDEICAAIYKLEKEFLKNNIVDLRLNNRELLSDFTREQNSRKIVEKITATNVL